ncbi:hypothetical protein [Frankia tisae]|uniref:hypothetical protein n=1 Tax=Frankia tisae TaxID=2950104 RepID=UPI0021BEB6ED|nr:hypothetical protein [Frankia tisae]
MPDERPAGPSRVLADAARAAHPRARLGALDDLRILVDAAAFSPGPVDEADAARAWQLADGIRRQVAAAVPLRRRLVARLDIRPLLRRAAA